MLVEQLNLYSVYKAFYQRHKRNPDQKSMAMAKDLVKRLIFDHQSMSIPEMLELVNEIKVLELRTRGIEKYYSLQLIEAIESGGLFVEVPYAIRKAFYE
jgi:hypothetical protein